MFMAMARRRSPVRSCWSLRLRTRRSSTLFQNCNGSEMRRGARVVAMVKKRGGFLGAEAGRERLESTAKRASEMRSAVAPVTMKPMTVLNETLSKKMKTARERGRAYLPPVLLHLGREERIPRFDSGTL